MFTNRYVISATTTYHTGKFATVSHVLFTYNKRQVVFSGSDRIGLICDGHGSMAYPAKKIFDYNMCTRNVTRKKWERSYV